MLITDDKLNYKEFKDFFQQLSWIKYPRKLGVNHIDYFYVGQYDDEQKVIKVVARPSLRMQISESFKNRTDEGKIPPEGFPRNKLCTWGTTIEVLITEEFFKNLETISISPPKVTKQVVEW